jgi:hypothetical protein
MIDHYREAEALIERADKIADEQEREYGQYPPSAYIERAQVHALLAFADAVTEASNA